jgi:ppGpp synthetase/RelA/SpoT-type nucleotidyltranferase
MDEKILSSEFDVKLNSYNLLREEALFILEKNLAESDIKIGNIENRIKSKKSFIDKAIVNKYEAPFTEINDILGIRVIALFLSDIDKIVKIIRESFFPISVDDKINSSSSEFGYLSVHLIVKMKPEYNGPRYDHIKDLAFEIQVRTITMNSWANISHYLDYKSDFDIPQELKRDFYALSGLFYVADQHFELFFKQSRKNRARIDKLFEKGNNTYSQEINLDTLSSYLRVKLPDREHGNSNKYSEVIEELRACGYNSIQQIDEAFVKCWDAFIQYEKDYPPKNGRGKAVSFMDTGVIRSIFDIYDEKFRQRRKSPIQDLSKYILLIK